MMVNSGLAFTSAWAIVVRPWGTVVSGHNYNTTIKIFSKKKGYEKKDEAAGAP